MNTLTTSGRNAAGFSQTKEKNVSSVPGVQVPNITQPAGDLGDDRLRPREPAGGAGGDAAALVLVFASSFAQLEGKEGGNRS